MLSRTSWLLLLIPFSLIAQDTRTVREPVFPPACTTLQAKIGRAGTSLMPEDETKLDTQRIQAAIDQCPAGHAVVLQRSATRTDAFLSGPLSLRKGVTLLVDRGAFLYASRNPRDYDLTSPGGVCGTITDNSHGCKALINVENAADSGVMGDGVIDGRGGEAMIGQTLTWWNLADRARKGGTQNNPRLINVTHSDNFTLYRITLMNAPMTHVDYLNGDGFTAWGVKIWSPERSRNTDGIDPGNCSNVTITHCDIHTGDDQIAIKAGAGKPTTHMSIVHNHFYSGHGMSIGSPTDGGADTIRVSDLTIDGSDNGLRIKSNITRGGLVHDVVFEDVCIRNTADPVVMDCSYTAHASKASGRIPQFKDITIRNVSVQGGGRVSLEGYDAEHPLGIRFDNLTFDDPAKVQVKAAHAQVTAGPGAFNLEVKGDDVTFTPSKVAATKGNGCASRYTLFPSAY